MKMHDKVFKELQTYKVGVLSFIDKDGFPYSIKTEFSLNEETHCIEIPESRALIRKSTRDQSACLLFHYHNENLDDLRQFCLIGVLRDSKRVNEEGTAFLFTPRQVSGFSQQGIINNLKFLQSGRNATKRYFKKRGMKPPPIQFTPEAEYE